MHTKSDVLAPATFRNGLSACIKKNLRKNEVAHFELKLTTIGLLTASDLSTSADYKPTKSLFLSDKDRSELNLLCQK